MPCTSRRHRGHTLALDNRRTESIRSTQHVLVAGDSAMCPTARRPTTTSWWLGTLAHARCPRAARSLAFSSSFRASEPLVITARARYRHRHRIAVLVSERNARLFSRFGPRLVMRVVSATPLSLHAEVVSSPAQAARGVVFKIVLVPLLAPCTNQAPSQYGRHSRQNLLAKGGNVSDKWDINVFYHCYWRTRPLSFFFPNLHLLVKAQSPITSPNSSIHLRTLHAHGEPRSGQLAVTRALQNMASAIGNTCMQLPCVRTL
jgi:hypothetical protein